MTTPTVWKAATCALIALTLAPISVEATITSVTVNTSRNYENTPGYTYAEITVDGTVDRTDGSVGVDAVPAVLIPSTTSARESSRRRRLGQLRLLSFLSCYDRVRDISVHVARDRQLPLR